ncbi:MAG: ankyrin repeat domain-containing protein [Victivallales bacterium]|nr:ankyrin repeat domain-containing protein [Victivallales bacterium]
MAQERTRVKPDGFEYQCCCGRGSFGEAWLVRENGIGPRRILKLIYKDTGDLWETEKSGLLTYYEKLEFMNPDESRLFVNILHHGKNDDFFYYTMQPADNLLGRESTRYLPCTLYNLLKQKRLSATEIADISLNILDALKVLRKYNIVHRDIKPQNIFFFNGTPRIGDIGLMQSVDEDERIAAEAGCIEFVPPEARASGAQMNIPGPEWDLYAFGKVLYSMDTGNDVDFFPNPNLTVPSANREITSLWERIAAENKNQRLTDIDAIIDEFRRIRAKSSHRKLSRLQITMLASVLFFVALFCISLTAVLSSTSYNSLFDAIEDNSLPGVIRRMKKGDSLASLNDEKEQPIVLALKNPNIDIGIIQVLYEKGAYSTGQEKASHIEQAISNRLPPNIIDFLIENATRINEIRDSEGGNLLHSAIRMHDSVSFLKLLPSLDVNSTDRNGHSALMLAIHTRQTDIAKMLMDKGADIAFRDKDGFSLLHIYNGDGSDFLHIHHRRHGGNDDDSLSTVLLKDADVNQRNIFGETPLLCAVRRRAPQAFIAKLISHGADANIPDFHGITPLAEAIALGNDGGGGVFDMLIQAGAKIDVKDANGFTPLHIAAIYRKKQVMIRLIGMKADINAHDVSERTPLHRAVMIGCPQIVECLLHYGADTMAKDALGLTPADMASIFGFDDVAALLPPPAASSANLQKYRNLLSQFSLRHRRLDKESRAKLIDLLSAPNFQLDFKNNKQTREFYSLLIGEPDTTPEKGEKDPIRLAIDNQNTNILIKLLACAPNLDIADESGITPVLATALSNKIEALHYLCYNGADISAKANGGMDIMRLAYLAKSYDIIGLMTISMHEPMLDLPMTAQHRNIILDSMKHFNNFPSITEYNQKNNIFNSDDFLLAKIRGKNTSAVARSLSAGVSTPNAETGIGRYALTDENLHFQMMETLLRHGAQPNIHSVSGNNAICKAIYDSKQFYFIRLLLDYGANPTLKDSQGVNAFQAASESRNSMLGQLLDFYYPIH